MDDLGKQPTRRAAKVGHRKSRNGCTVCKTRRVKCDEVRPFCSNCQRLSLSCTWPNPDAPGHTAAGHGSSTSSNRTAPTTASPTSSVPSISHRSALTSPSSAHVSPGELSAGGAEAGDTSSSAYSQSIPEDPQHFSAMLHLWSGNTPSDSLASETSLLALTKQPVAAAADLQDDCLLPESRERRLLEHRLFQNYLYNLGIPFPVSPSHDWNQLWTKTIPPMALQYDNILYAIMAHSATHLLRKEPDNRDLFRARQAYLVAAMRVQRRMVEELTLDSADAVCLASLIMLVQAFAMLDERVIDTYSPPMDWLRLGRGAGSVIWLSIEAIMETGQEAQSVMMSIANAQPRMGFDESYFDASNREQLNGILAQDLPSGDDWEDEETRTAYEKTLSYIGFMELSMRRGEPIYVLCRRVQGFTMVIPPRFIDFVGEQRPRALVILAHFFAGVHALVGGGVWWLGGEDGKESIAKREVRGIRSIMPPDWMSHMIWPCEAVGLR